MDSNVQYENTNAPPAYAPSASTPYPTLGAAQTPYPDHAPGPTSYPAPDAAAATPYPGPAPIPLPRQKPPKAPDEHDYEKLQHVKSPVPAPVQVSPPPSYNHPAPTLYPIAGTAARPTPYPVPGPAHASGPTPYPPAGAQQYPPQKQYPLPAQQYPPATGKAPYGQPPAGYHPQHGYGAPEYGASPQQQQQQQQQQVVVVNAAQYQPVTVHHVQSFTGHIAFSCIVTWFCNPFFGLIAFIFASTYNIIVIFLIVNTRPDTNTDNEFNSHLRLHS